MQVSSSLTIRSVCKKTKVTSIPFSFSFSFSCLLNKRSLENRFLLEWKQAKDSFDFWNSLLIIFSQCSLEIEDSFQLACNLWKVWYPRTSIERLTEEEKRFLTLLQDNAKLIQEKEYLYTLIDGMSCLPSRERCVFFSLHDLLYLCCCCYYLGTKNTIAVPVWNLKREILIDKLFTEEFVSWYNENISFLPFRDKLNLSQSCSNTLQDNGSIQLSIGFPPFSTHPFPWWLIENWMNGTPLPVPPVTKLLEECKLRQLPLKKPLFYHQPSTGCCTLARE